MKTLNILKKHNFTDDVQKNIKLLLKKYGDKFNIKFKKYILLSVKLCKDSYNKCYVISYDIDNRNHDLMPLKINFHDPILKHLNNNSYITNSKSTADEDISIEIEVEKKEYLMNPYYNLFNNFKSHFLKLSTTFEKQFKILKTLIKS